MRLSAHGALGLHLVIEKPFLINSSTIELVGSAQIRLAQWLSYLSKRGFQYSFTAHTRVAETGIHTYTRWSSFKLDQ